MVHLLQFGSADFRAILRDFENIKNDLASMKAKLSMANSIKSFFFIVRFYKFTLSNRVQPKYFRHPSLRKSSGSLFSQTPSSSMQMALMSGSRSRYRCTNTPRKVAFIMEHTSSLFSFSYTRTRSHGHHKFHSDKEIHCMFKF